MYKFEISTKGQKILKANFAKFSAFSLEFQTFFSITRTIFLTVGQNNFGSKIPKPTLIWTLEVLRSWAAKLHERLTSVIDKETPSFLTYCQSINTVKPLTTDFLCTNFEKSWTCPVQCTMESKPFSRTPLKFDEISKFYKKLISSVKKVWCQSLSRVNILRTPLRFDEIFTFY